MNKILKRIKSLIINNPRKGRCESDVFATVDCFSDEQKNNSKSFLPLDIHDKIIELAFIWNGDGRVDDLDLAAIVLNSETKISLDSDFVYFNSRYRVDTVVATPKLCLDVQEMNRFYPSNKEGSVILDGEFSLYLEEQGWGNCEAAYVDLGKIDTEKVSSIVFYICNYSKQFAFKYLESLMVCLYSGRPENVLKKYSIPNFPKRTDGDALCLGSLEYSREDEKWSFHPSFVLMCGWWNKVLEKYT